MVMEPDIPYKAENFLTSSVTLVFLHTLFLEGRYFSFFNLFMVYLTKVSETAAIKHW